MVGPAFKGVRWLGALAVGDVENPGFPGLDRGHDRGGLADDRENAVASPPKKWKQRRRSHRTSAH